MKRILYISISFLTLCGCSKLVEEDVYSTVTPISFFTKEAEAITAVNGVYSGLQEKHRTIDYINALMAGEFDNNFTPAYNTLLINDANSEHWDMWTQNYKIIGRANVVLAQLEKSSFDQSIKDRYAGEVRFIRAFCYFNMVRTFGHFPLVKTAPASLGDGVLLDTTKQGVYESEYLKQVDREEIYDFIIQELKFCETALPKLNPSSLVSDPARARATSGSASGMLARVYLTRAGLKYDYNTGTMVKGDPIYYDLAAKKCQEIIDSHIYSLLQDFALVFENSNDNNNECLFSIQAVSSKEGGSQGEGADFAPDYGIKGADITPFSFNANTVNVKFFNDWVAANGTNDKRYATTFMTQYVSKTGAIVKWGSGNFRGPITRKLVSDVVHPINAQGPTDYGDNMIVQRYADVLLMHSEALNELQGPSLNALNGINEVRARAGKTVLTLPITQSDLREAIWNERKWELCFEGVYSYYDCQRTGRLLDEIEKYKNSKRKATPTVKFNIMPIPYIAIQVNPSLKQNLGW